MSNGRSFRRRLRARYVETSPDGRHELWKDGRTAYVVPALREDEPPAERNAIAVRREATLTGRCQCGAEWHWGGVDELGLGHLVMEHEDDCAVVADGEDGGA